MARILGIDYGKKKTGLATTDPLQIIVTALDTVMTADLEDYLMNYTATESVEKIVIGRPTHKDGNDTYLVGDIMNFRSKMSKLLPEVVFDFADEMYTSKQAKDIIFRSGVRKSKRRDKMIIDKVSAVLILQKYLRHI